MNFKNKAKIIMLSLGIIVALNSCLAVAAVGAVGAGISAAVSIIELPIKIISGVVNIVSGSSREKEVKKVGETKYTKAINKVLASNRKEIKIGNFNVYIFETLEFTKQDKLFQLTDTKNKIQFPFTANVETYNSKEELENKLDEFSKSEGVSKGTIVENQSIKTHSYEVRINNKKEKTIEIDNENNLSDNITEEAPVEQKKIITITAVGDIMLGSNYPSDSSLPPGNENI